MRLLLKAIWWLVVAIVSLILVIGLILFFESRDRSSVEGAEVRLGATV